MRLKSLIVAYVYSSGLIIRRCNSPSAPLVTCVTAQICAMSSSPLVRLAVSKPTLFSHDHVAERYAIAVEPHRVRTGLVVFFSVSPTCTSSVHASVEGHGNRFHEAQQG